MKLRLGIALALALAWIAPAAAQFSSSSGPSKPATPVSTASLNPTGTASLSYVMMGLGSSAAITPIATGKVLISISGTIANSVINDGSQFRITYGTGTAPANAAALTGTQVGCDCRMQDPVANQLNNYSTTAVVTGLALGTPIWVDLSLAAVTGGTVTITNTVITLVELSP